MFSIIVAVDNQGGMARKGEIPWDIPKDMRYFHDKTINTLNPHKKNAVIMGRKTWDALSSSHQPLPERVNLVLSHQNLSIKAHLYHDFQEALDFCYSQDNIESIFVIGGEMVYQNALQHPELKTIYLTQIMCDFHCDKFFPEFDKTKFQKTIIWRTIGHDQVTKKDCKLYFAKWEKKPK